ncbi:MAG: GspE/PulE/PilB domain-containing protein, partial [Chloroflexota bacterium]
MSAAADQVGGKLWAAWSPQSLHPWAPPRLGRLTELVPRSFWLANRLVPLRVENTTRGDELVVAATSPDVDPLVLLELRQLVRRPVRVMPAAGDDVEFWLDVLFRGRPW